MDSLGNETLKANELRIGNLVEAQLPDGPYFSCKVDSDLLQQLSSKPTRTNEFYKPIPLTEEWLLRLGFKNDSMDHWHHTELKKFPVYQRGKWYGIIGLSMSAKEFEYVHQLQNAYFALTGEELEVKESARP